MRDVEFDKLTDELIDARNDIDRLEGTCSSLSEEIQASELAWMQLKDRYGELACALGLDGDSVWGDPLVSHADVLAKAKELAGFARVA